MAFYDKVIDLAKSQVGYHEGRANGHWNNDQRYSKEVPGFGWSNRQAWCATFNTWLDWRLGLTKGAGDNANSPCTASVLEALNWGKRNGRFSSYPVLGAWVIYGTDEHTERCIGYDDSYIYTVGGNTNSGGGSEGDGVYLRKRARHSNFITGYVVPVFPDGAYTSPDPKWHKTGTTKVIDMTAGKPVAHAIVKPRISLAATVKEVHSGKSTGNMKIVQHLLNAGGYSKAALGKNLDEDGQWGPQTRTVVMAFQIAYSNKNNLKWTAADCDGYLGMQTFTGLVSDYYTPVA